MDRRISTKTFGKKAEFVWLVIPFSKPEFFKNIIINISHQTKKENIKICIIENGDAIGVCKSNNFCPDLLLTSEKHQSIAKNTGLEEISRRNGEFWTTFDCDDYYGPKYIEELLFNSNKGDIVGKNKIFVKNTKNKLWLPNELKENKRVNYVHGPTISGWVEDFIPFKVIPSEEDLQWIDQMKDLGAITYATSKYNFCYNRYESNHTFSISDQEILNALKDDVFEWDLDFDIINGIKEKNPIIIKKTLEEYIANNCFIKY